MTKLNEAEVFNSQNKSRKSGTKKCVCGVRVAGHIQKPSRKRAVIVEPIQMLGSISK